MILLPEKSVVSSSLPLPTIDGGHFWLFSILLLVYLTVLSLNGWQIAVEYGANIISIASKKRRLADS